MSETAEAYETSAATMGDERARAPFDPRKYLVKINGRGEYLEVKWRLAWLRDRHPDAIIETELTHLADDHAVFKARVAIPGGGVATGWGSEDAGDFRDFLEKAETKSIGRALAALGFGTQYCQDHEFGAASNWVVDSPVDLDKRRGDGDGRARAQSGGQGGQGQVGGNQLSPATGRQRNFIHLIAREAGLDDAELHNWSQELYGMGISELNRRDASALIEALQRRRNELA